MSSRKAKKFINKINMLRPDIFRFSMQKGIDLVIHARFTVLPYFFAEPFGIAAANSVLCGNPLITFPYGNLRNFTRLLPKTLDEMIKMVKMSDEQYSFELKETLKKGNELRAIHKPENAIKNGMNYMINYRNSSEVNVSAIEFWGIDEDIEKAIITERRRR